MTDQMPQSYANHGRYVPMYHFVASTLVILNFVWSVVAVIRQFSPSAVVNVLTAIALLIMFWYMREFAARNQDRIIRLEMRLRLAEVLPAELKPRIGELTTRQLVALRFAGDAELPGLVKQVLGGQLASQQAIKLAITDWQADFQRI